MDDADEDHDALVAGHLVTTMSRPQSPPPLSRQPTPKSMGACLVGQTSVPWIRAKDRSSSLPTESVLVPSPVDESGAAAIAAGRRNSEPLRRSGRLPTSPLVPSPLVPPEDDSRSSPADRLSRGESTPGRAAEGGDRPGPLPNLGGGAAPSSTSSLPSPESIDPALYSSLDALNAHTFYRRRDDSVDNEVSFRSEAATAAAAEAEAHAAAAAAAYAAAAAADQEELNSALAGEAAYAASAAAASSSSNSAAAVNGEPSYEKTYDGHQQAAAARRILELCEGKRTLHTTKWVGDRRYSPDLTSMLKEIPRFLGLKRASSSASSGGGGGGRGGEAYVESAVAGAPPPPTPDPLADARAAGGHVFGTPTTDPGGGTPHSGGGTVRAATAGRVSARSRSWTDAENRSSSMRGLETRNGGSSYESYQYEEDESRVHFELRTRHTTNARRQLAILWASMLFVVLIGAILGCIAAAIVRVETWIVGWKSQLIELAFYGGDPCDATRDVTTLRERNSAYSIGVAYLTYTLYNTGLIALAATATYFAPQAATSGLPPLKAFLNGVYVPSLLSFRTLIAKVVGVTLVVSTGLPLGREGPMVHTGAVVAARVTRAKFAFTKHLRYWTPVEVRVPSAQRNWVGIGCAAGVAAAFNAPLGGILYSFEEVCSHWSAKMTWRSFFCVVVAALVYNGLILGTIMNQDVTDNVFIK